MSLDVNEPTLSMSIAEILKSILLGLGTVAVWLLKKLGDKHIESIEDFKGELQKLNERIESLIDKISSLSERVVAIEVKQEKRDHHE